MARDIHLGRSTAKQKLSIVENSWPTPPSASCGHVGSRDHISAATTLRIFCRPSVDVYNRGNSRLLGLDG